MGLYPVSSCPMSASISLGLGWSYGRLPSLVTRRNYVNRLGTWNVRRINDIIAGVQDIKRSRSGVALLLSDVWNSAVDDLGCVSSGSLWVKFTFSSICGGGI